MTFLHGIITGTLLTLAMCGILIQEKFVSRDLLQLDKFMLDGKYYRLCQVTEE